MTIWFIADTHFGEQPKTRKRLSGMDAAALDALMMERWRATVAKDDVVWHLGDVGRDWQRLADRRAESPTPARAVTATIGPFLR